MKTHDRADDDFTLKGVEQIADFIEETHRRTYYLCENSIIPAWKLGGRWHMRPAAYRQRVRELEQEALARGAEREAAQRKGGAR